MKVPGLGKRAGLKTPTVVLSCLCAASPSVLYAAAEVETFQLEEVVVTAQKRAQSLQDVPVAVSVVDGDDISSGAITDLEDLSAKIPTVKIAQTSLSELINIRGFGSGNNVGFEQAVSTFVDGSYRARAISRRLALLDVERVEVLKGPQTTFFGANATAGAFSVTTKKSNPGDALEANVSGYYDPEYDEYTLDAGISGSLTDTLSARIAGKLSGSDGYVENRFTGDDETQNDDHAVRASFAWEPTDSYRMDFRVDTGEIDADGVTLELLGCNAGGSYGVAPSGPCAGLLAGGSVDDDLDYKTNSPAGYFKADFDEFELTNRWDLDVGTINFVTSYYEHDSDRLSDPMPLSRPLAANGWAGGISVNTLEEYEQFSQEVRFESTIGDSIEYMVGVYYLKSDLLAEAAVNPILSSGLLDTKLNAGQMAALGVNSGDPLGYSNTLDQEQETISVFTNFDISLSDVSLLSLGLRYSEVEKDAVGASRIGNFTSPTASFSSFNPFPNDVARAAGLDVAMSQSLDNFDDPSRKDSGLMPSVTYSYDFNSDVMGYAKYTKGFKAGGYAFNGTRSDFDKETVEAYELGVKASLLDGSMFLTAAAFLNTYEDLQESGNRVNGAGAVETFVDNVGEAESRGVELGVKWRAMEALTLDLDVAWLDATYKKYEAATCDSITMAVSGAQQCDLSGKERPFSPTWSGTVKATYEVDLNNGGVLSFSPSVDFSSEFYTLATLDPVSEQESYHKVNLRIGYASPDESWSVALVGKNLNDETTSNFRNILPQSAGSSAALADPPRTVGVQFSLQY